MALLIVDFGFANLHDLSIAFVKVLKNMRTNETIIVYLKKLN